MALHLKAAFAKMCGLTTGNLTVYITRKKVVSSGDYIDDSLEINKAFLEQRAAHLAKKVSPVAAEPEEKKLRMIRPDPQITELPNIKDPVDEDEDDGMEGLETLTTPALMKRKLHVDIKKKIRETSILDLKEQKIKGEIVPVDVIKNLFSMHTQSIITAQKDGIEELLINLSVEARLTGDQLASLRGKMVQILNNAVDKAIIITQKNMKVVVNEFAISKEVGEHE
jgi:hypothetical protein